VTAPQCPNCGRKMFDDSDGMTGGWFCASNHRAIIIIFGPLEQEP